MAKNYINNADLLEELRLSKEQDELTHNAILMIMEMAKRFGHQMPYVDPMDGDDCRSQAIMDVYAYWRNFDVSKGTNAFAYITQLIKNGYAKGWRSIHKIPSSQIVRYSVHNIYSL